MATPGRHGDACPICLQPYAPLDKAVISSCLHAFCYNCLLAWCERKRACPVCRGKVASIYHSIQSDDVFVELELPTAAEEDGQQQQQPAPGAATAAAAWAGWGFGAGDAADSLQGQPAGVLGLPGGGDDDDDAQEAARPAGRRAGQPRVELAQERFTSWGDPEDWLHHVRNSHRQQQQQQQQRRSSGGSNSSSGQQGGAAQPRPYFWRMQQHMMASLQHPSSSSSNGGSGSTHQTPGSAQQADAAQASLQTRRAVYVNNLWAKPYEPPAAHITHASSTRLAATPHSSNSSSSSKLLPRVSDVALQSWLQRELQALLLDQDVTIVSAYVRGLINSFGLSNSNSQQPRQPQQQQPGAVGSAVAGGLSAQQQACTNTGAGVPRANRSQLGEAAGAAAAADALGAADPAAAAAHSSSIPDAVTALQAFLFDAAGHFWHELSCFGLSGLSLSAWDRVVWYGPQPPATVHHRQQQQRHASQQQGMGAQHASQQQGMGAQHASQQQQQQTPYEQQQVPQQPYVAGAVRPGTALAAGSNANSSSHNSTSTGWRPRTRSGWDAPPPPAATAAAATAGQAATAAAAAAAAALAALAVRSVPTAAGASAAVPDAVANKPPVQQQKQQQQGRGPEQRHGRRCSRSPVLHGTRSSRSSSCHRHRHRSRSRSRRCRSSSRSRSHRQGHTRSRGRSRLKSRSSSRSRQGRRFRKVSSRSRSPTGHHARQHSPPQPQQQHTGQPAPRSSLSRQQPDAHLQHTRHQLQAPRRAGGWQRAALLKQLGATVGAAGGGWHEQQQQSWVSADDRWQME